MKTRSHSRESNWIILSVIISFLLVALVFLIVQTIEHSIIKGVSAASASFQQSYESSSLRTSSEFYQQAFEWSESEHHVRNRATIRISDVQEKGALEVLRVSDVVYVILDGSETKSGYINWLKVTGHGVFSVDLKASEFIVDNDRRHVLIRVPHPKLNSYIDAFKSLFDEQGKINNGSFENGIKLFGAARQEALYQIQVDFEADVQYTELAEDHARAMLITLIKSFNPDVENLQVEVEFYD